MNRLPATRRPAAAFTILEVVIALAILAGSVAVLSEIMSVASRQASAAQAESTAQLLASSAMDEMLSGMTELTNLSRQAIETDTATPWVCSVTLGDTTIDGILSIEVLVEQDLEKHFHPVKFRLLRWIPSDLAEEDESTTEDNNA